MKSFKTKGHIRQRRVNVVTRLQTQLTDGVKNATIMEENVAGILTKKSVTLPLTEADRTRIKKEISILETRI